MELGFASKALRRLCQQDSYARSELGEDAAAALRRRLADLEAVDALTELPWLPVVFGEAGDASIEFHPGYNLNVVAVRQNARLHDKPEIDWTTVDRLKILDVTRP